MTNNHVTRRTAGIIATVLALAATRATAGDAHGHAAHAAGPATPAAPAAPTHAAGVPAADAVKRLADGNARFTAGAPQRPNQGQQRLCDTFANGQHPFAAVLSCADSRVPPEFVFDAGIGDLFVVRVAGNVADVDEIGTLEYGVEHLGINAILVLGHTKCGAVTAVVDKAPVTKNVAQLVDNIVPAADDARRAFPHLGGPQLVGKAIEMNVRRQMADLVANSDVIKARVKAGTLRIVGGVYDLHSGEVNWLEAGSPPVAAAATRAEPKAAAATPPKGDAHGHAAPAAKSPSAAHRAASDKSKHGAATAAEDARDPSADKHSAADAADGPPHTAAVTAAPAKKENFLALGGLLAGGCGLSYGVLHFMKSRPAGDSTDAPDAAEPKADPANANA